MFEIPDGWKVERAEALDASTFTKADGLAVTINWANRTYQPGHTPYLSSTQRGGPSIYAGRGWKDAIQRDACAFLKGLRWV